MEFELIPLGTKDVIARPSNIFSIYDNVMNAVLFNCVVVYYLRLNILQDMMLGYD